MDTRHAAVAIAAVESKPSKRVSAARARVINVLNECGGEVADDQGQATIVLKRLVVGDEGNDNAFSNLVKKMGDDGQVERDVVGKRTYAIRLTGPWREVDGGEADGGRAGAAITAAPPVPARGLDVVGDDAMAVLARELLLQVAEILAREDGEGEGGGAGELAEVKANLATAVTHSEALERKWRDYRDRLETCGDELAAVKIERDALKSRLRGLDANLTAALRAMEKGGASDVARATKALGQVERFMQERPARRK